MSRAISVNWGALALRGLAGILIGVVAFLWPGVGVAVLVALVGAYLLVTGALGLLAGVMGRSWMLVLQGVLGLVAGVLAFVLPGVTALALVYLVAAWAILTGFTELGAAFLLRRVLRNEWLLILGGIISIVFGVLLILNPLAAVLTITWIFGAYALISGVLLVALALRLRGSHGRTAVGPLA